MTEGYIVASASDLAEAMQIVTDRLKKLCGIPLTD